jgi:Pilus formation protein N terminal region
MRSFTKAICGGVSLAALALASGAAQARDISIPMDEVRIVTFPTPVSTVYVGNPAIADVTVIDSRRVFILGKAFGATNLVALDAKGNPTVSERVTVFGRQGSTVTLHRGAAQTTYACAGTRCEAAPVPGDDNTNFDSVVGQRDKLRTQSASAADAPQ